jgi:putative restriction endonuclease
MAERIFGHLPHYPEGSCFASREELSRAGVHRPRVAGISGRGHEGADSVVLAGRYENTEDRGNEILYTGHGGREPETNRQVGHQTLTRGNLALAVNKLQGLPVRVIRGATHQSPYSPTTGYCYDGLYRVEDYWRDRGRSGFFLWRFRLVKDPLASAGVIPILRVIRETEQSQFIKALYYFRCQICRARIETPAGPYAEAVHLRPLTPPHNGPDTAENIVCLCPNHHVRFTTGGIAIADDLTLIGEEGQLMVDFRHKINTAYLQYHREHYLVDLDVD